jgi:hypothetical protein
MPVRKLPRPFEMHWGSGEIVEEATCVGEYHGFSLRFCSYNHRGSFQRSPLMVGQAEIDGLRKALQDTPRLREILKQLVAD